MGASSGGMLGLLGGMEVCNRTLDSIRCSRVTGGAIGLTARAIIGARNEFDLDDRFENAGMGTTIGAVRGLALKQFVRQ